MQVEAEPNNDWSEVQRVVTEKIGAAFIKEIKITSEELKHNLSRFGFCVVTSLTDAHGAIFQIGAHDQLDLDHSLGEICSQGADLLRRYGGDEDEVLKAAQLTYESVGQLIAALAVEPDPVTLVQAGIAVGRAEVRLTQVMAGLWGVVAAADFNAGIADGLAETRRSGGSARGAALSQRAAQWKAKMLPVAEQLDRENPDWDRQKLAMEIIFKTDLKEVGIRSVEDWLKKEAEEPNGPIRSRARKQKAKQPSQGS